MRRIGIVNLKGGASKTTTATALAVGLARRGKRSLLIDCDAQANATWTMLGGKVAEGPTLAAVLMRQAAADEAIRPTDVPGLDLLPADATLSGVNVALVQELGRDSRLRSALAPLDGRWDYVIADTAPSVTTVLANALVYVAEVIVPVDPGVYALLGLVQLQEAIEAVREAYGNHALRLAGLLLTRATRNNVTRDVERELRERFGPLVYGAVIPLSAKIEEACTRGTTVLQYAPQSAGAVAYDGFIEEVIANGRERTEDGRRHPSGGRPGAIDAA